MKKIFSAAMLLAALGIGVHIASADDLSYRMESDTAKPAPAANAPNFSDASPSTAATDLQTTAPVMAFVQPVPAAISPRTTFVPWPVVTFGFGFGHPYVSGYYRGNYGRANYRNRP